MFKEYIFIRIKGLTCLSKTGDYITQKTKIDEYNMNTSSSQLALSETGEKETEYILRYRMAAFEDFGSKSICDKPQCLVTTSR